jgi:hypothetical protein
VARLLAEAERVDEQEDQRWGTGQPADPWPAELAHAQSRLERLRQAKAELEREAQEQLEAARQNYTPHKRGRPRKQEAAPQPNQDPQERQKARNQFRRAMHNAERPTRQYNFVDPDSRVMKDNARKCFAQAYNAQVAADTHAQVIVAAEVTQQTTDRKQLLPMVESVRQTGGGTPQTVTADAGYWDTTSLSDPTLVGIQVLVPPDSDSEAGDEPLPPHAPQTPAAVRMREILHSETGRTLYAARKATVEPVFGQIKEARQIRRFRLRSLKRVAGEWKLICATHNLLKLFRHRIRTAAQAAQQPSPAPAFA